MRIISLDATAVHGFIPVHLRFFNDLSFLIGMNGSGKTTALRLLMALLTPNADELEAIDFGSATVVVEEENRHVTISAQKTPHEITLSVSDVNDEATLQRSELQFIASSRRREGQPTETVLRASHGPVIERIAQMATPMFLGIDRRFHVPPLSPGASAELRRREFFMRRNATEEHLAGRGTDRAFLEASFLVQQKMQDVLADQEQLDERLRNKIFALAFVYRDSALGKRRSAPSKRDVETYRRQLERIEQAAESTRIPVPEIQAALDHFFSRLNAVIDSLERQSPAAPSSAQQPSGRPRRKPTSEQSSMTPAYLEWIINKPQADRIVEHLELLDRYVEDRNNLRSSVDSFVALINSFYQQTQKLAHVSSAGRLGIRLLGSSDHANVRALSSGEGQLLVMLAHLSLNPSLSGSSVFIVDEPELSLHIAWQERFVDAVLEANPGVQVIMATHSPAIILDQDDHCLSMEQAVDA